ncbi:hypothetical protein FOMPIDRAFT_88321 [Fomitopsis schrenkii]|uniref:Uncharacterized protein n=1 Tax=Fomitopsis schrenkii TaxID=2126942 RepID=S8E6S9_FOMSC|nr:hypothetical protein FOMPIDRAFT_88321 [Fomitopsis schrenkii]
MFPSTLALIFTLCLLGAGRHAYASPIADATTTAEHNEERNCRILGCLRLASYPESEDHVNAPLPVTSGTPELLDSARREFDAEYAEWLPKVDLLRV